MARPQPAPAPPPLSHEARAEVAVVQARLRRKWATMDELLRDFERGDRVIRR